MGLLKHACGSHEIRSWKVKSCLNGTRRHLVEHIELAYPQAESSVGRLPRKNMMRLLDSDGF